MQIGASWERSPGAARVGDILSPPRGGKASDSSGLTRSAGLSTPPGMRIMLHDPNPTRRHDPQRTAPSAAYRPVRDRPRPPGDGPALRRRLVAATHRPAPRLSPAHRPRGPQGLSRPRPGRLATPAPRPPTGPAAPPSRYRPAPRPARPAAHLDQPPAGRGLAARHRPQPAPGAALPGLAPGPLPPHGADGPAQAGPRPGGAGQAGPGRLAKKAPAGRLKLYYFDECGFAPALPTNASWCLPGQRQRVPHEYPSGRRVNALAADEPLAAEPWLGSQALERTLTSGDVLAYLRALPAAAVPRVVVLDNAGLHTSKQVKAERKALSREGSYLYFLPAYSPELNAIEPVFQQVQHHDIPTRSPTSKAELRSSVEGGVPTRAKRLREKSNKTPRRAA